MLLFFWLLVVTTFIILVIYFIIVSQKDSIVEIILDAFLGLIWVVLWSGLPLALYLFFKDRWLLAGVSMLPIAIVFTIAHLKEKNKYVFPVLGNFSDDTLIMIESILATHERKIKNVESDVNLVMKERINVALTLGMHKKLTQFFNDVRIYLGLSDRFNATGKTGVQWNSKIIDSRNLSVKKLKDSFLKNLADSSRDLSENTEILDLEFTTDESSYDLVYIITLEKYSTVMVYENKNNLVYKFGLEIDAFKPDSWIVYLFNIINQFKLEKMEFSKKVMAKKSRSRERDIKENFLD